ncbi:fatty acid hydroxylase domain-containing protein 2-like [Bolinopsis microptera]|uniref:fatty acid hydroxylase domain-containing protein 2-like n=1 Tax=Bolinopsis microptera TaxID=2820187 RepID=UPI00307AEE9B
MTTATEASRPVNAEQHSPPKGGVLWETLRSLLFISGTAILTTIAVKNSVNPYIDKIWGASHDFWGSLWTSIYELFGRNDFLVHFIGSGLNGIICFTVFNALFLLCDITGHPTWLLKYKVQDAKNQPVDRKRLWSCIRTAAFNLGVVSPVFTLVFYKASQWNGSYHKGDLPTFNRFLLEFLVFNIVEEIFFYYSHRILHHPKLYARFHKKHHEWTAPIGITSIYCTPLEMVVSNLFPIALGPFLMQSHLFVTWIWFGLVLFSTTLAHGGYHVPFLFSPEAHDYHHKVFNCLYGTLGILDKLHKTDKPFAGSVHEKRHYISYSLTPIKQIHPEPVRGGGKAGKSGKAE